MKTRNRAKCRYFLVSQVSIKNAPNEALVCVRPDENDAWEGFINNNEESSVAATYREVGPVCTIGTLHNVYNKGLASDREAREALAVLTKDELIELALKNGL